MEQLGNYTVIQEKEHFNDKVKLFEVENGQGEEYEIIAIYISEKERKVIERLIKNTVTPFKSSNKGGLQRVIEFDFSEQEQCYFIVYEFLDGYESLRNCKEQATVQSIIAIAKTLEQLKKENKQGFIVNRQSIRINEKGEGMLCFAGLFVLFERERILSNHYLAPNVLEWLEDKKRAKPNFQDDIYSLVKSFSFLLEEREERIASKIIEKALKKDRKERYGKYHELIEDLEKLPIKMSNSEEKKAIKIVVQGQDRGRLDELLKDMNTKVWFKVDKERSKDRKIGGKFSTQKYSGKFIVDTQNHLFIPYFNEEENFKLIKSPYSFVGDFFFTTSSSNYKCVPFFEENFNKINQLATINSSKTDLVKQWKTLPDKEKEFIEERAFRAKFYKREPSSNKINIDFYLKEMNTEGWQRVKELKTEKIILYIDNQRIGKIQNFKPKERVITIGDPECSIDEIDNRGELIEDVSQEVSQYKKQVEACEKFRESDVVNPLICSILATPEDTAMPYISPLMEEDYEYFDQQVFNENIKHDPTQKEAILEALYYKPVYLIQGPPGTGKTTVIVEIVQQILTKKGEAKILITSQSNLAVDNVLERIQEINEKGKANLKFMRLASDFSVEKENVKDTISPYVFEKKLEKWVQETIDRSEEYMFSRFKKSTKNKELINFYNFFVSTDWEGFLSRLKISVNYLKKLFGEARNTEEVRGIFIRELGKDFIKLKNLQKDWFAFLGGVNIHEGKNRKRSMLNNGSSEIDFLTAMMRDINIIGATCIHIASSKYSKVDFNFDYVIMDESSKASPAETLVPVNMGKNIILIGDHKQLPPIVTREKIVEDKVKKELEDNGLDISKKFGKSLFESLVTAFEKDEGKEQYIKMLDIQYRMPKQVGTLISKYFYDGKLKNPASTLLPNYDKDKYHGLPLKNNTSILFISTSNEPKPYDNNNKLKRSNQCNVDKIKNILKDLNDLYPDNLEKEHPFSIGIIAGYRGQVELLKKSIDIEKYSNFLYKKSSEESKTRQNLISINTVDQFQGAERDIIIYDIVRSSQSKSFIGFLDDYRRINVAFSRVKKLLIIVGDSEYLIKKAMLHRDSQFREFRLKQIAKELNEQGYIFNNLKEAIDEK